MFSPDGTRITFGSTRATPTPTPTPTPGAVATRTTLTVTPSGPLRQGTQATLTATVTPPAAGTVQFKDGTTNLGGPVTVNITNGTASKNVGAARVGSHTLTAVFTPTPTNPPAFLPSTSTPVTKTVTGVSQLNGLFVRIFTLIGVTPL